jgi:hypothetical protein
MRFRKQKGGAIILVVVATGLLLIGALGLAIDAGQLYGQRQMAQAAADATAMSAILSVFGGTNTGTNAFGTAAFTCTNGTDARSPCGYARVNGFGKSSSSDTVAVDFPASVSGVSLAPDFTPAAAHVLISRPVKTTLMRLLGAGASTTIKAAGTAAIVRTISPVPILVLHRSLAGAFSMSGGGSSATNVKICGGPKLAIQVNSHDAGAVTVSGSETVDLSKGGPLDTSGNCTAGTGSDFGVSGGPVSSSGLPSWMTPAGTSEHYLQPNPPMQDPLADVPYPARPAAAGTITAGPPAGTGDCPSWASAGCTIYTPGYYTTGIGVKNTVAIFNPGIYYVDAAPSGGAFNNVGFGTGANGDMIMCSTSCVADTSGCCASNGMLVYLTAAGGVFSVASNSSTNLLGSDIGSTYKGILFFDNRSAPAATGSSSHLIGGGGSITLRGTIYLTNTTMTSTTYQNLRMRGHSGSSTLISGEIIVSALDLGGGGSIVMNLSPNAILPVDQVALVN